MSAELIERIIPRLSPDERRVLSLPTIQLAMLGGSKGITIERHQKVPSTTYKSLVARGIAKGVRNPSSGIMPLTQFGERLVEALGPSTADPVWPCGHPRTPENIQKVGVAGDRCRTCRNEMHRRVRLEKSSQPCSMGVGCDEAGVCYAAAHGRPEECPKDASRG